MRAVAATVVYLLLAHTGTLTGRAELRVAAAALLVGLVLLVLRGWPWLQLAVLAVVGACFAFAAEPARLLLYAPPVLVPLLLAALCARSLRRGRQSLIERVIWHLHGRPAALSDKHRRYARAVTVYWCLVFVAMAAGNLALALLAPPATWSWFGNVIAYALPPLALIAEYGWRKHVFPEQQYRNLFDFLARVARLVPVLARDLRGDVDATHPVRP